MQCVRHAGVKKSEEETEMKGEEGGCKGKGREMMMEDDVKFPLACSNNGEKKKEEEETQQEEICQSFFYL